MARPQLFRSSVSNIFPVRCLSSGNNSKRMNVVLILGSTRTQGPPFPANIGKRVGKYLQTELVSRGHEVVVIDPVEEQLDLLQRPQFAYGKGMAPKSLNILADKLNHADAYVMCSPEYNHAPSPALLNILNHFGSSIFSFKPSSIVTYSAGQWGGTRAAHSLRAILSELGCLPVSAMVHIPRAHEVLDEFGLIIDDSSSKKWSKYVARSLAQLEWWGVAAKAHKMIEDPWSNSPVMASAPSDRNAP